MVKATQSYPYNDHLAYIPIARIYEMLGVSSCEAVNLIYMLPMKAFQL